MLHGHGDDIFAYPGIKVNFSSNVYNHFDHSPLYAHLAACMPAVANYPEPSSATVERAIAQRLGIDASQVIVTNGAIEAIYLIASTQPRPAKGGGVVEDAPRTASALVVTPTFSEYADACRLAGIAVTAVDQLPSSTPTSLAWLCNPNNPTGTVMPLEPLLHTIDANPQTLFVIDASYSHFTQRPLLPVAEAVARPNVIMLHSMTKRFAVPGLRIGFVTAHQALIGQLRAHHMPWSVNSLAQKAAMFLLEHESHYTLPLQQLLDERQRVAAALAATGIVDVHPSDTHILLCHLHSGTATALKAHLANNHGILIRDAANFQGLTPAHFRIAVQSPPENDQLISAFKALM
ncbi:MAG: aminotransferase class I/II-fold pyridoxal phosphate-dependent enzyme [Bacteroidaceae bacterium]|nr:aminotransferase class I/II-fold pyridoxal phosphate-dependent enzyme [Bacteroidaceae bacterium]